jgi:hypothetical protein
MKTVLRGACAALLCLIAPAWAAPAVQAGEYEIRQCNFSPYTAAPDMQFTASPASAFTHQNNCSSTWPHATVQPTGTLSAGQSGAVRWVAPDGLGFRAVTLKYAVSGRGAIQLNDANNTNPILISATNPQGENTWVVPGGGTRSMFRAVVPCNTSGCILHPGPTYATVMNFSATIGDLEDPIAAIGGGSLFDPGPVSGARSITFAGLDGESGVHRTFVWVNGTHIQDEVESCTANQYKPCSTPVVRTATVNTTGAPFVEGVNVVTVCARDYAETTAPNQGCADGRVVVVDN